MNRRKKLKRFLGKSKQKYVQYTGVFFRYGEPNKNGDAFTLMDGCIREFQQETDAEFLRLCHAAAAGLYLGKINTEMIRPMGIPQDLLKGETND